MPPTIGAALATGRTMKRIGTDGSSSPPPSLVPAFVSTPPASIGARSGADGIGPPEVSSVVVGATSLPPGEPDAAWATGTPV